MYAAIWRQERCTQMGSLQTASDLLANGSSDLDSWEVGMTPFLWISLLQTCKVSNDTPMIAVTGASELQCQDV